MSRPGNPYDNAKCESWMKTLKAEEIDGRAWATVEELEAAIATFIDVYYNQQRLHSALGYCTPDECDASPAAFGAAGAVPFPAALSFPRQQDIYPDVAHH